MSEETPKKRGRGRPRKGEIVEKTAGTRGKVGRPKGDASIINEYKARMLASPKSIKVLETIFEAALDHDHKNQAAAWKLVMDRILPVGAFEKEVVKDAGRSAIQINITGVGATEVFASPQEGETIDGEAVDVTG
tara:strand:+ start:80 stop:481 length:402 start_codon:yes stop_codon:yes gene_type:complete